MSADWPNIALSDVCDFKPAKKQAKEALADGDLVSFAPMGDLGELQMAFAASDERPLGKVYSGYTYFADGDVLCAKITPCFENGKMGVAAGLKNGVGFGSSEFVVMRPSPKLSAEYLFYFMLRDEFREAGAKVMTGAVGHRRVPKDYFEDHLVPLPPAGGAETDCCGAGSGFRRPRPRPRPRRSQSGGCGGVVLDDQIPSSRCYQ